MPDTPDSLYLGRKQGLVYWFNRNVFVFECYLEPNGARERRKLAQMQTDRINLEIEELELKIAGHESEIQQLQEHFEA
jgi:hypothetical protein